MGREPSPLTGEEVQKIESFKKQEVDLIFRIWPQSAQRSEGAQRAHVVVGAGDGLDRGARRALASRGFNEAITWAFLPEEHAKLFGGGQPELKLANPISSELSDMRPSLLPNLIAAAGRNLDRGFADMMLSEVGHAYAGDTPKDETLRAAGIRPARRRADRARV